MRLLIFTQKIDSTDSILGFFCGWVSALAKEYDFITVVCLEKGIYDLPENVSVYSLGKEDGAGKLVYIYRMYKYLYTIKNSYDAVFIHMNQEYVVLAGLYWKMAGIPVYLWRNHPHGDLFTRLAIKLSTQVFYTSPMSFTAKFSNSKIMPVGVDISLFKPISGYTRKKHSVCMVSRISPIKGIEIGLEAIKKLIDSGTQVSLSVVGSPLPKDELYYASLKSFVHNNNLGAYVQFMDAVPQNMVSEIFSGHEIYLNLTTDGSFDKTIVEAVACGAVPVISNKSLSSMLPELCITERNPKAVAEALKNALSAEYKLKIEKDLEAFTSSHSLERLVSDLVETIK